MEKLVAHFVFPVRDSANKGYASSLSLSHVIAFHSHYLSLLTTNRSDGLTPADVRTIFSNAELIWNCNREFLSDLSKRFPWTPSSCIGTLLLPVVVSCKSNLPLGDVLLRFIPFFKLYKEYGAKYLPSLPLSLSLPPPDHSCPLAMMPPSRTLTNSWSPTKGTYLRFIVIRFISLILSLK